MRLLIVLLAALAVQVSVADGFVVARRGAPAETAVVLPQEPTLTEKQAALELVENIEGVTGVRLPVARGSAPTARRRIVLGGATPDLGEEGFRLTVTKQELRVAGGTRGVLYGVYELLERFAGCGWYSSTCHVMPPRDAVELPVGLDETQKPAFDMRSVSWAEARFRPKFAARLRLNSVETPIPARFGGDPWRFVKGLGISHTLNTLVDPDVWYAKHPEYFAFVDGKRRGGRDSQLCLTNPDVMRIALSNVLVRLEAEPEARFVGISQNDNQRYCRCPACAAVDEEEGSHAGSVIRFVNAIAAEIEKVRPDVFVQTLAYQYTRKPPAKTRPRANVVPCLCAILCARSRPIEGNPREKNFMADLKTWSEISENLYLWDYTTNFRNYLYPFPCEGTFLPNIRTFRKYKTRFLYEEGGRPRADFAELKTWLLAKWMWNPDLPEQALLDRFFVGYYGAAAPFVREYWEACQAKVAADKGNLGLFDEKPPKWFTSDFAVWGRERFARAAEAVRDDPIRLENVRNTEIPILVAELNRRVESAKLFYVTRHPNNYKKNDDLKADVDRLCQLAEPETADEARRVYLCCSPGWHSSTLIRWKRMVGEIDRRPSDRVFIPAAECKLETRCHGARVNDPEATTGTAVEAYPTTGSPIVEFPFANLAYDQKATYRVRLRVKVVRDRENGAAFRAVLGKRGEHKVTNIDESSGELGEAGVVEPWAADVKPGYQWYEFPARQLNDRLVFEFGSGPWVHRGGVGVTKSVFLDGLEVSRAEVK